MWLAGQFVAEKVQLLQGLAAHEDLHQACQLIRLPGAFPEHHLLCRHELMECLERGRTVQAMKGLINCVHLQYHMGLASIAIQKNPDPCAPLWELMNILPLPPLPIP